MLCSHKPLQIKVQLCYRRKPHRTGVDFQPRFPRSKKMIFLAVASLLITGSVLASTPAQSNQFMDGLLNNQLKRAVTFKSLDPKVLPNFQTRFLEKIFVMPSNVQTSYSSGRLNGLSVVSRSGSCTAPKMTGFGNATLNCTLIFPRLSVDYAGSVSSPNVTNIRVQANITRTEVRVELTGQRSWPVPNLRSFNLVSLGNIAPRFIGLGQLLESRALRNFTRTFSEQVSSNLYQLLNHDFQVTFAEAVRNTRNMPMPK